MKTVCIIGAGPAGLVAAKTFLQKGGYTVTVFEATDRVGGMWRAQPGEHGDKCSPEMRTNLSRFTVAFSDLAWSSVDLSTPKLASSSPPVPPIFPKAWQVGRYLAKYAQKFEVDTEVKYNKRITRARLTENLNRWEVTSVDQASNQQDTQTFDYLVVASGFFDRPTRSLSSFTESAPKNVQHSSQFRTLSALSESAGKVAVIGGGISGSEAAAQAAFQISSAKYSPGKDTPTHADSTIYHIINRPFYCLPRYLPRDIAAPPTGNNSAPSFLPLDLVLYNLSRRVGGEISAAIATVPPEKAEKGHQFMRSVIGSDQADVGHPSLVYEPEHVNFPGYTGITDTYLEFVRSGVIVPIQGWAKSLEEDEKGSIKIAVEPKAPWASDLAISSGSKTLNDVIGVIEATGFETNLEFLDDDVKQLLAYEKSCPRVPLLLSRGSIFAPKIPTIAFVGFYEGPYWGVMELQARLIVDTWARVKREDSMRDHEDKLYQQNDAEVMRRALEARSLQVPQFWMADYVGLVEELARRTGVKRNDSPLGHAKGPAFPSRYIDSTDADARVVVDEVAEIVQGSVSSSKFVAAAVFRGMQGMWTLKRKIDTRKASSPGGSFSGTAHFHPRQPTGDAYSAEYLYQEQGTFAMDNGLVFPASRRYIYRYNEAADRITAWFADEDGKSVGALFNTWEFSAPSLSHTGWVAKGYHWCDPDKYRNICEFIFKGASLQSFDITYEVEGPNKDYSHHSCYARPELKQ
ncbi:hypothetical protein DE146DRAFT_440333 [Phaeosphaeria sp. MPI-PUGE-AT-0046c]|nr:hypothetical protein DE146DRAFT_440333 [Phaeosphaeria sp. MPI-PUGE-AT-0046c]